MADDTFRASEYVRIKQDDDGIVLQTREEVGRGKRFGTGVEVALSSNEAERMAKWVLAQSLND